MPTVHSLFRELVVSTFDVIEPTKLLLEEFWDALFAQDGKDILVDAFYEAVQQETRDEAAAWTKNEIKKILELETNINFGNLDNNSLADELKKLLTEKNVAILPSRMATQHDFEQITSNVVIRAMAILDRKIHQKENGKLREALIEKSVRDTGRSQALVLKELSSVSDRVNLLERNLSSMDNKMNEAMLLLQKIDQTLNRIKFLNENKIFAKNSVEDLASYNIQLTSYKDTVRLIAEHWSEFASPAAIPIQERKDLLTIKRRIDEISQEIGMKD
jgi:hypothetical protein